jgi:hypothetical protein
VHYLIFVYLMHKQYKYKVKTLFQNISSIKWLQLRLALKEADSYQFNLLKVQFANEKYDSTYGSDNSHYWSTVRVSRVAYRIWWSGFFLMHNICIIYFCCWGGWRTCCWCRTWSRTWYYTTNFLAHH